LPPVVQAVTNFFLDAVDAAAPGLIQGLYLTGSVALHDFQANSSDVDFVAISAQRADAAGLQGLAAAHSSLWARFPGLHFDGTHLSQADLVVGPQKCPSAPFHYEGKFNLSGDFAINPVTWHELAGHSVAVRGPSLVGAPIWHDTAVLSVWTLNNLREYWQPWLTQYRNAPAAVDLIDAPVTWGVLGVSRLHYTLATGQITSKTGAGQYALDVFDGRWSPIISEALRLRLRPTAASEYTDLAERRQEAVAFMEMVINTTSGNIAN